MYSRQLPSIEDTSPVSLYYISFEGSCGRWESDTSVRNRFINIRHARAKVFSSTTTSTGPTMRLAAFLSPISILAFAAGALADDAPSDVISLTNVDFDSVVNSEPLILVEFFAPW